jgi:hypothetical protein
LLFPGAGTGLPGRQAGPAGLQELPFPVPDRLLGHLRPPRASATVISPARIDSTIRTFSSGGTAAGLAMNDQTPSNRRARKKRTLPHSLTRDKQAQAIATAVRDEQEYFSTLTALGIQVRYRIGPESGDVIGYSLARPGDVNAQGEPVYFGGSKLSPDLSINRLRERLAAQQSLVHLRTAYRQTAEPIIADLTRRTPTPKTTDRLAAQVQAAVPDHAQRILADLSWPALATALAQAESSGQPPRRALTEATQQRELTTADRPAEVLLWHLRNATSDRIDQRTQAALTRTGSRTTPTPAPTTPTVPTRTRAANDPTRRR